MPIPQRPIEEVFMGKIKRIGRIKDNLDNSIPFTSQLTFFGAIMEKIAFHQFGIPKNQYKIITTLEVIGRKAIFNEIAALSCIESHALEYHLKNAITAGLVLVETKETKQRTFTYYYNAPKTTEILKSFPSFKELFFKYI